MKHKSMGGCVHPFGFGLIFGIFMALVHTVWSLMVLMNLAQPFLEWILGLHFVSNPYWIQPFDLTKAMMLVGFTFIVGFIGGWVFGILWHWKKNMTCC